MTFALWTILAAAVLPYLCTAAAKFGGGGYDNASPRTFQATLHGWRARAHHAHLNHFEAFAPYAAAVLVATWVNAPQGRVDGLAAGFIGARLVYTGAYLAGWSALRSVAWAVGFGSVVLLFCSGL